MSLYVEGDVPYVANGNCNGNNGWNDWSWIIGLALVGGLFGNGGFGFGGGFGRGGFGTGDFMGWQMGRLATTNDVASGFSTSEIMSDLNSIILGQATMQNFINQGFAGVNQTVTNGFAGVQQTLCQGFNGVDRAIADTNSNLANAICTLGYQNQSGFNALSNQIASCCCDLKQLNLENRYLNEKQTCDIIGAINAGNQRLVDIYTSDKLDALRAENTALKGQISNSRQTADIVSQLRDPGCPVASYLVPNPNCCYNPFGFGFNTGYGVGTTSGCGCGASIQ